MKLAPLFFESLGAGVTVLCLPAFPFERSMYRGQRSLADQMRLLLVDYPGTGNSDLADAPVYAMDYLADCMLGVLDAAGCKSAILLGTSMGVYVALALLQKAPARVRGLILADSRPDADAPAMAMSRQATVAALMNQGTQVLHERVATLFSAATRSQCPEMVNEFQARLASMSAPALARLTLGIAARLDRRAMLPDIQVPVLLVVGEEDTVSPPSVMQTMARAIPDATFQVIAGAGHLTPLEQPEIFNSLIKDFVLHLNV